MGLLGIERAELYDSGTFTCQVKDWGQQQCRSINVHVEKAPSVKIEPLNIVAHEVKIENFGSEKIFGEDFDPLSTDLMPIFVVRNGKPCT